jgi:hypothetical protein
MRKREETIRVIVEIGLRERRNVRKVEGRQVQVIRREKSVQEKNVQGRKYTKDS